METLFGLELTKKQKNMVLAGIPIGILCLCLYLFLAFFESEPQVAVYMPSGGLTTSIFDSQNQVYKSEEAFKTKNSFQNVPYTIDTIEGQKAVVGSANVYEYAPYYFYYSELKQAEDLEEAIKKKNSNAQYMKENPLLMKPETMKQFKVPTAEEMQKAEKEMVKEWEKRKKESKPITGLILTLTGTIIRVLPAIIMEDTFGSGFPHVLIIVVGIIFTILGLKSTLRCSAGVFGKILLFVIHGVIAIFGVHIILALVPVFSIVFLLWAAMLYSESGGGGFFSSGSDKTLYS